MDSARAMGIGMGEAVVAQAEGERDVRKGPWTVEEDLLLVNYITAHGDGRWNSLARSAGLKRTGKSCRLRWLNYLRPDVRRGNFTPEEQLLILELHSRWGNRWSKIAQHLPGRTDNEIKNYWRTRVQKLAKQLKYDVNSQQFKEALRHLWIPRLMERIQAASASSTGTSAAALITPSSVTVADTYAVPAMPAEPMHAFVARDAHVDFSPDRSNRAGTSSDSSTGASLSSPPASNLTDCYFFQGTHSSDYGDDFAACQIASSPGGCSEFLQSPCGYLYQGFSDFDQNGWAAVHSSTESLWPADDTWFLEQQLVTEAAVSWSNLQ